MCGELRAKSGRPGQRMSGGGQRLKELCALGEVLSQLFDGLGQPAQSHCDRVHRIVEVDTLI